MLIRRMPKVMNSLSRAQSGNQCMSPIERATIPPCHRRSSRMHSKTHYPRRTLECTVPINVVLIRETYGDGHQDQWALMDTRPIRDPVKPREQLRSARGHRRATSDFKVLP